MFCRLLFKPSLTWIWNQCLQSKKNTASLQAHMCIFLNYFPINPTIFGVYVICYLNMTEYRYSLLVGRYWRILLKSFWTPRSGHFPISIPILHRFDVYAILHTWDKSFSSSSRRFDKSQMSVNNNTRMIGPITSREWFCLKQFLLITDISPKRVAEQRPLSTTRS